MEMRVRMLMVMMVVVMLVTVTVIHQHIELRCAQIRADGPRNFQLVAFHRQLPELAFQVFEIQAQIEKRTDGHIATDAGKTVKEERLHTEAEC